MPIPSVEPIPLPPRLLRLAVPDEAQEASYLAASARISSFCIRVSATICSLYVLAATLPRGYDAGHATPQESAGARPRGAIGRGPFPLRARPARGRRRLARLRRPARRSTRQAAHDRHRGAPEDHPDFQPVARHRFRSLGQRLPRLRARLHLLLRPSDARIPRPLARARLRDAPVRRPEPPRAPARNPSRPRCPPKPVRIGGKTPSLPT